MLTAKVSISIPAVAIQEINRLSRTFAPGVKVSGPGIRDSYVQRDGTSVAAALTAGSCALLMEWGQKLPFSRYLSTYEMKNLLIRGAIRNPDLFYPNREWGYGTLDIYQVFRAISTT